ncbi:3-oxoacyl-[acyl-carrier-protein] synthase III C-terminal domain-containing protein [Flavobacterium crassostreae]|uniref:Chalcone/stilbene synthase C-terminal domain-containing protein n=1 Tax=Flavobacterium crassostreae TaxID=1763534 RepID=A0A1B9E630_9FLAO|nr:3-oxoacyl-[acyl-carrier-protein] synthase III C-terminal domain-containing protein [Flavobacterium crassostreae]OCB77383.1 hypothetical protein LPBF_05195 [Flavobacterium crassostreae]
MKTSVILSNFQPILVGKLIDQNKLNLYTKFLYHHFQDISKLVPTGADTDSGTNSNPYDLISANVDKYSVSSEHINKRQLLIFEEVYDFIENNLHNTAISDFKLPQTLTAKSEDVFGPKINYRMEWFKQKMKVVFDTFYANNPTAPENLVHVTCSGYASPSVAQEAVIKRDWGTTQVTHSYQMGCYGAFPAIRTANSLMCLSDTKERVDIVHTELLSAHLNLTEFSAANTMICSLFGDGFIGYSLYDENAFMEDTTIEDKKGLRILASHEMIIPDSLEDMSWDIGEYNFLMTLSKRVPVFIRNNIKSFIETLCSKANIDLEEHKYKMHFAIHPGGPKIIDYIVDEINVFKEQACWSYEVLRRQGNMSSATIPHIFNEIVNDSKIESGTKIVALAFGPGLTATALLLEKL